ncbi:MAG: Carboxypeptidase regulatory-like domain, partial [Thermoplasmata archaeon]|nr:Carboxypeptidase regulatory-like domain [Thermoplasmata archaeon]
MTRPAASVGMRLLACFLLAFLALAGCAGGAAPKEETGFEDLAVEVTDTTGAIRCLVVDDMIRPVEGATVTVRGASDGDKKTKTDAEGRCVFSGLAPGTYFVTVDSPSHKPVQSSTEVIAGEAEPPLLRIQVERLFTQDPFTVQIARDGFFECSQSGASIWYSSSGCADGIFGPASQAEPSLSNVTQQDRDFHADVGPGWQEMVFEMTWEPTSQGTSQNMGIVVSTYKPERDTAHWFAAFEGSSPMRGQLDVGVTHESASGVDPEQVPAEGLGRMSYFVSVRGDGFTPGIALNQRFTIYLTMFH